MLKKKFNDQLKVKNQFMEKCKELEKEKKDLKEKLKKKEKIIHQYELVNPIDNSEIIHKKSNSLTELNLEKEVRSLSKSESVLYQKKKPKQQNDIRNKKLITEIEELKKFNLILEKEKNHQKKINKVHLEQISSFITEIRSQSEMNLEMKKQFENIKEEKEIFEREKNKIEIMLNQKVDMIKDFEIQIKSCMKNESELREILSKMESKIVKPKNTAYIYNCYLEGLLKEENVLLILRENFRGEIILEIENFANERFFVKFKNILKIEREKDNKNRLKIYQKNFFNRNFILNFKEDNQFYDDLKKYWEIFISEKEKEKDETTKENNENFISSIKNIIFN